MGSPNDLNQYLVPTLEGFRNKLLDLTTRNNLLNLSLSSKRTARLLRFIDCDPQAVLAALCDGTSIQIIPLPDPPDDDGKDEAGEEFEKALVIARKQDPLYQQVLADSANDQGLSPALVQAEDRLRSMLREDFGQKSKSTKSSKNLAQWAEAQGISSTYELTVGEGGKRGIKDGIRVLQLEASLERLAEGIRKQARSSIDETGNNILYLAFGCLEWSEKDRSFFAPLILLPVEISKAATRGGAKTFCLRAADDAPVGNVTLKERLRRDFLVDLPMPAVDSGGVDLMAYFAQVADAISEREDWGVSRLLNLALFNFSGLGLYEDLDPEVVKQSVLIRQLLAAEISDEELPAEADVVAEDQHVDHPDIAERVPVLITQADASQFSGIADVMSGRSMVIEGPPGTGKSQTITNIIANALCSGQRVLFVAEKKVALDVVFTRLADAGLRPYCLRIASDKTNKREVYDELAQRLLLPKPESPRRDAVVEDFQQLRSQLNSFSELLNTRHGPEEESPQELFWRELLLRQELQGTNVPLGDLRCELNEATQYTRQQIEQITQAIEQLARLCTRADFQLFRSTFGPLGAKPSDALSRDQLMDQAQGWHSALVALSQHPSIGETVAAMTLQELRQWAREVSTSAARLPEPLSSEQEALLPVLASQDGAGVAEGLLTALKADQASFAKLLEIFTRIPDPLPDGHAFTGFAGQWNQWSLGEVKMPGSAAERDQLNARFGALSERLERIQVIASTGSGDLDFLGLNRSELVALEAVLGHLSALPSWVLEQRQLPLWQGNRGVRIRVLIQNHLQLKAECQRLGLDRGQEPQANGSAELQNAADLVRQCCQGGLQPMLGRLDATKEWATQLERAEALLLRVEGALSSPSLPMEFQGLRLEQLQELPDVLKRLMALSPDALRLRVTELWTTPLDVINAALQQEQELQQKQQALARDGLRVSENLEADELRAAATKLETMSPLRKLVSRSYARASKLAAELGAVEPAGKPEALRRGAEVLEMQASFPNALVRSWCSGGINLAQASAVVKELAELKGFIGSSSTTAGFLEQARTLTVDELSSQIELFEGGLSADLDALVCLPLWSGLAIGSRTASDLRRELAVNQGNLQQLERVNPYAVWAMDAGVGQPNEMAAWLEKVIGYRQQEAQFPTEEFEAGLGLLSSEPLKAQEVLDAAARNEELTNAGGLGVCGKTTAGSTFSPGKS